MTVQIRVKGFGELISNVTEAGRVARPFMQKGLVKSTKLIQKRAKQEAEGSKDTGKLIRDIHTSVKGLTGEVIAGAKHSMFIEKGTTPHFPPVAPLEAWAARKLGSPGLGFVIARKIAREGTEAQPFMEPAARKSEKEVINIFRKVADDLVKVMAK